MPRVGPEAGRGPVVEGPGVCYFDTDLRYREINAWLAALNGLDPADHIGREISEVLPSVADSVVGQLRYVIETGEPIFNGLAYAETAAHPGVKRLYQHNYQADKSAEGIVQGVRCFIQDVTPQRLLAVAGVIPWEADARTRDFSYVGQQAEEMLGHPIEGWYESGFWASHIHPDDREFAIEYSRSLSETRKRYEYEYRMLRADGGVSWIRDVVSVESANGSPIILHGFMFDISDLKATQRKLELSERQLRGFLKTAPDASLLVRADGTILFANDQVNAVLGYAPEQLIDKPVEVLIPERFRTRHGTHIASFLESPTPRPMGEGPLVAVRKDGTEFPAEISLSSLDRDGELIVSVALRDISEKVAAEVATQKLLAEVQELRLRVEAENVYLRDEVRESMAADELVGESPRVRQVKALISQVAGTDATVLVEGETGTGKELVARSIHAQSARSDKALVKVNCATLPSMLIESELFGHVKGAFTGAITSHLGRFELADGGTIFLDETGDLPLDLQPKLLRVLQEGEFERLGSSDTLKVDVRVIAATNHDLEREVAENRFRKDLFYRLMVFPIHVPPLCDRVSDIPLLVWFFLSRSKRTMGRPITSVPDEVMGRLTDYSWPGNIRELENVVERAVILTSGDALELSPGFGGSETLGKRRSPVQVSPTRLEDVERSHILSVLEDCGWVVKGESNAAEKLGLHPSTLANRMKKLGIKRSR